jgi:hypothetical protein
MTSPDVFTTETAGLPQVARPSVIRLRDGDHLDLDISPVRNELDGAGLRMLAYKGSIPGPTLHVDEGQPSANPNRTAPVRRLSSAGMNGTATRSRAATSPAANEPATIQPMCPLGPGTGRDGPSGPLSFGVVVTMDSIPCAAGVVRVQR